MKSRNRKHPRLSSGRGEPWEDPGERSDSVGKHPQDEGMRTVPSPLEEALLSRVLRSCADPVILLDEQGSVRFWNRGAEKTFGYTPLEMLGRSIHLLIPETRKEEFRHLKEEARQGGVVCCHFTTWWTKHRTPVQVVLTLSPLEDGEQTGWSLFLKDVTRRLEMEDQSRLAEHFSTIGRLASGVAHEVKNPLAGIKGALEVIQDQWGGRAELSILKEVLRQVDRIDQLVCRLVQYARPKSPDFKPVPLVALVCQSVQLVAESAGPKVRFDVRATPALRKLTVLGDDRYLREMFMNLLLNAAEAMDFEGTVTVRFETDPGAVTVRVEDTGPGVPALLQSRIFDPFFTTKPGGTGLGLATCNQIVHQHGGTLSLDPTRERGAAFLVRLPRKEGYGQ